MIVNTGVFSFIGKKRLFVVIFRYEFDKMQIPSECNDSTSVPVSHEVSFATIGVCVLAPASVGAFFIFRRKNYEEGSKHGIVFSFGVDSGCWCTV